jgi:hypothetical protein
MERYNKDFNAVMGLHPSLVKFCNDLEREAKRAWTAVEDARAGRVTHGKKRKEAVQWPEVPDEFLEFVVEKKRKAEEKKKTKKCGRNKSLMVSGVKYLLRENIFSRFFDQRLFTSQ